MGEALRKLSPPAAWRGPEVSRRPATYASVLKARALPSTDFPHLRWAARQLLAFIAVAGVVGAACIGLWSVTL